MNAYLSDTVSPTRKPNICLMTESYYPLIGGGETQSRITAEDLSARGFNVMVVTRQTHDKLETYEKIGDIQVYRVPPTGQGHLKRWVMIATVFPLLVKQRKAFDVLFVCSYRAIGITGVIVSLLFNKTCIFKADNNGEMSGDFFAGGLKKWNLDLSAWPVRLILSVRNNLFKKADMFISISSEIDEELKAAGISPSKIHTIPNSVDVSKFYPVGKQDKAKLRQKLSLPANDKIIIFTGRLLATKGLPLLIEAWKALQPHHPHVKLLIVGGGSKDIHDCETFLHDFVKDNHLTDSVIFTGNVSNVDEYLKASDIFVFPTEDEAFGISMIEAMACGLAAIATPVGGLKDIITPEQNGLFVEVGQFEALKQALITLITNPQKAAALGQAALTTVQERYTRAAVAQTYDKLLTKSSD